MEKKMLILMVLVLCLAMETANADFTFGEPINLGPPVNNSYSQLVPSISSDGLELYFGEYRPDSGANIWMTTRETIYDPWTEPVKLGRINSSGGENGPCISPDGLSLFFHSTRSNGYGGADIWVATRETTEHDWGFPVNLGPSVNSSDYDAVPSISADGLRLYFNSNRPGGYGDYDLWVTTRATIDDDWGEPEYLEHPVNTSKSESGPGISADELLLFFVSDRIGGRGGLDIWMTRRVTTNDDWGEPVNLGPTINSSGWDGGPRISADGRMLYYLSQRSGGLGESDLWQVPIDPIFDINSDGIVDAADMSIIVDNWGTDNTLCDIGPLPWGDGIVDVQDLIVLAEHLFEDYRLVAHWKLDETEGDIAYDSIGANNATVHGEFLWQPASGKDAGALEINGFISTPFVLNPGNGSFGVFAWVKVDESNKVIISQTGDFGDTWLSIDPSGKLMTEFSGIYFGYLVSETIVTDGQWHHVGFVYDMDTFIRNLYVDGDLVAEDETVVSGMPSDGGLHIGASKDLGVDTFFSGLINDVRIYNKALTAEEITTLAQ